MYGLVIKADGTQTVLANLGRIDRANTATFFRTYITDAERLDSRTVFSHGDDGSITATVAGRTVKVITDAAEADYFRAQRRWMCGTMSPSRAARPTWAQVQNRTGSEAWAW